LHSKIYNFYLQIKDSNADYRNGNIRSDVSVYGLSPESIKTFFLILAGLLTFPVSEAFPSQRFWNSGVCFRNIMRCVQHRDYSYGDSSGFTPGSLLMQ
jgi:hypothetical protein